MEANFEQGKCILTIVPVRSQPGSANELVNQLIYGDTYDVLERKGDWLHIRSHLDQYTGWINDLQFEPYIPNTDNMKIQLQYPFIAFQNKFIPFGALDADCGSDFLPFQPEHIKSIALPFLHAPYLWGGKTAFGIDCSGFTQLVYRAFKQFLPRDAQQQAELGARIDFPELAQIGDLAFFDNAEGRITHVGLLLNDGKIIHASGEVRIDSIDHYGIYRKDRAAYSHNLRMIKRIRDFSV